MKSAISVTLVILVLVLAYALSIGPMFWLCSDPSGQVGGYSGQAFLVAYTPIIWPLQKGPEPVRKAIRWYLSFFRPMP